MGQGVGAVGAAVGGAVTLGLGLGDGLGVAAGWTFTLCVTVLDPPGPVTVSFTVYVPYARYSYSGFC